MKWAGKINFDDRPQYDTDGLITSAEVNTISGSLQADMSEKISNTVYSSDWNGVTDIASSQNAVYDELENRMVVGVDIDGGSF